MVDLAARDVAGTFNACSPAWHFRMDTLVDALVAAAPSPPLPASWVGDDFRAQWAEKSSLTPLRFTRICASIGASLEQVRGWP
jgi:hypothetical protein